MLRSVAKIVSVLLLLSCFLSPSAAQAATDPANVPGAATCDADSMATLYACALALETYDGVADLTTEIRITAMIECSGSPAAYNLFQKYEKGRSGFPDYDPNNPDDATPGCLIPVGAASASSTLITGSTQYASPVGLHRTANYGYEMIDVESASNVTLSNFTIHDEPDTSPGYVLVDGPATAGSPGAVYCGIPDSTSTVASGVIHGFIVSPGDTGDHCPMPGYVTVLDSKGNYDDMNAVCYPQACLGDVQIDDSTNITMSGMILDRAQSDAVDVTAVTKFFFLNNVVENAYYRGLTIGGAAVGNQSVDMSIENNVFFANRAAGLRVTVTSSSWSRRPSDISGNIFDHNQHGDAFPCFSHEGCSGGQIAITGNSAGFIFANNTFLNGYMDFYDPNVFDEGDYGSGNTTDAFTTCDLSARCYYYTPAPNPANVTGNNLTLAGQLWFNGGGVNSSWNHGAGAANEKGPHQNPDVEITDPVGDNIFFADNTFDFGSYALFYDPDPTTDPLDNGALHASNNEFYQETSQTAGNSINFFSITPSQITEVGDCTTHNCEAAIEGVPTITGVGPATASAERSICGTVNCLWATATETWSTANSLALGSGGTGIQCALKIYGPGGNTLLATVQGSPCTMTEGVFTIPGSVAQHYTSVQVAFEDLGSGIASAKQLIPLAGMTPTITGTGATTCSGSPCAWVNATDAVSGRGNCAVGIYTTGGTLITTLTGSAVTCASTQATFYIPASVENNYSSVKVNYQNLVQGTWSTMANLTL